MKILRSRFLQGAVGFFVLILVLTGGGVRTFWRSTSTSDVAVLEGPPGLIVLTAVHRSSKAGLIGDTMWGPTEFLYRSDVHPDGSMSTRIYRPKRYLAIGLVDLMWVIGDDVFLLRWMNDPVSAILKLGADGRIVLANAEEQAVFLKTNPSPEWTTLKTHQNESTRHAIAIREERDGDHARIVAESTSKERPWRRVLVDVDTRRWHALKAYDDLGDQGPSPD